MTEQNHPFFLLLDKENFPPARRTEEVNKVLSRYGSSNDTFVMSTYEGDTDDERFRNCITDCPAGGTIIIDKDFTYTNTDTNELILSVEGVTIDGMGHKITFTNYQFSGIQVRADNVVVKNLELYCSEAGFNITPISSSYLDLPARQRSAGVFIYDCDAVKVDNVHVEGFSNGITVSAKRSEPSTLYVDHKFTNISVNNFEQGILATQCDRLVIDGVRSNNTLRIQENGASEPIEPHTIYMTTTLADDDVTSIENGKVTVRNCDMVHNHFDSFLKFKYCTQLLVTGINARDTEILMQIEGCPGAVVSDVLVKEVQTYVANTQQVIHILESTDVSVYNSHIECEDDEQDVLYRINTNSDRCRLVNCGGIQARVDSTGSSPFLVASDYCTMVDCYFIDTEAASDDPMVDCSGDYLTVKYPRTIGLNRVGVLRDTDKNSQLVALAKDINPAIDATASGPAGSTLGWRTIDTGGGFNAFTIT